MKIRKTSVTLEVPVLGECRVVWSALEALDCLMSSWRGDGGVLHKRALNACIEVLDNGRPTEFSRNAISAAAHESHIAVRSPRAAQRSEDARLLSLPEGYSATTIIEFHTPSMR